ncbi:hypothetical protein AB0I16_14295 [Streptomyces sp. NPDC050703]|uniref:hypothetical protein n=1 Tax=Streptomyces sp. NPDC050703 TaxID=3157218 RepID=UPI003415851B
MAVAITRLRPGPAELRRIAGSSASALPPASSSYSGAVSAFGRTPSIPEAWAGSANEVASHVRDIKMNGG